MDWKATKNVKYNRNLTHVSSIISIPYLGLIWLEPWFIISLANPQKLPIHLILKIYFSLIPLTICNIKHSTQSFKPKHQGQFIAQMSLFNYIFIWKIPQIVRGIWHEILRYACIRSTPPPGIISVQNHMIDRVKHWTEPKASTQYPT